MKFGPIFENNRFEVYAEIHKDLDQFLTENKNRPFTGIADAIEAFFEHQTDTSQPSFWDRSYFAEVLYGYFQAGELLLTENPVQKELIFCFAEIAPYEVANDYKLLRYINAHWKAKDVAELYEYTNQNMYSVCDIRQTAMMDVCPSLAIDAFSRIEPYAGQDALKSAAHQWELWRKSVKKKYTIEIPLQ